MSTTPEALARAQVPLNQPTTPTATMIDLLVFVSATHTRPPEGDEELPIPTYPVCTYCNIKLGTYNMRQLCGKTRCDTQSQVPD
jgi:hypothetical protein